MAQTPVYFTGFETGDASEVAAIGGGTIQSTIVRTGGYALRSLDTGIVTLKTGLAATQSVMRAYCYFQAYIQNNFFIESTTGGIRFDVFIARGGDHFLTAIDASVTMGLTDTKGTTEITLNTWHCIEVALDLAAGGVVKVWVDGVLDINTTHSSNVSASPTDSWSLYGIANPNEDYFDDVRIDTGGVARIGFGKCVARQGIAGTPTYNAWTKNGLATAALCWSETPFSATNNCSDNVLNDAQTMIVDLFSHNPQRAVEGASSLGGNDTVNACKVAMIAKTAVAGNIKIRRRVNSADTDVTVALTTSDAYYDLGIFTDTLANLDKYEIGVANALVGTLETVEDMWMMVDFTENLMPQGAM